MILPELDFQIAPSTPALAAGRIDLWRIDLRNAAADALSILSAEEAERANRFRFEQHRARFITGRAQLRKVLARYLGGDPQRLEIAVGAHGKPRLTGASSWLRFNLSHSGDLMLLAVAREREIGVDVESASANMDFQTMAESHFSKENALELRALPETEKRGHFYRLWTATEARLKAMGTGLAKGFAAIEPARWSLLSFEPATGFTAALAAESGPLDLTCWTCPR